MKLFIHDLQQEIYDNMFCRDDDVIVIDAEGKYAPCQGCFGCWLKTPGHCFIKDELQHIGTLFGKCQEIIIISRNRYGGYSASVKRVLDRSIAQSLPFFTYRGGLIHHRLRYKNKKNLKVILYGDLLDIEKETASLLVEGNRLNMGCQKAQLIFAEKPEDVGALLT